MARARPVFVERGYAARTRQIAAAVGLTWGAIALRFGSKRALFTQAMAAPVHGPDAPACGQGGRADLHGLVERLRTHVWERWPLRLQFRLAATADGTDDEPDRLVKRLAAGLEPHVRHGAIRSDMSPEALARVVLALLTGDVAQRFMARERTLTADPAFVDGVVRLLVCTCEHHAGRPAALLERRLPRRQRLHRAQPARRAAARHARRLRAFVQRPRRGHAHLRAGLHGLDGADGVRRPCVFLVRRHRRSRAGRSHAGGAGRGHRHRLPGRRRDHEGRAEHQRPHDGRVDLGRLGHRRAAGRGLLCRRAAAGAAVHGVDVDAAPARSQASRAARRWRCASPSGRPVHRASRSWRRLAEARGYRVLRDSLRITFADSQPVWRFCVVALDRARATSPALLAQEMATSDGVASFSIVPVRN